VRLTSTAASTQIGPSPSKDRSYKWTKGTRPRLGIRFGRGAEVLFSAEVQGASRQAVITNRNNRKAHSRRRLPTRNRSNTYSRLRSPNPREQPERRRLQYQLQLASPIPSHRGPSPRASLRPNPDVLHPNQDAPHHPTLVGR
jgi:hypothetical protein